MSTRKQRKQNARPRRRALEAAFSATDRHRRRRARLAAATVMVALGGGAAAVGSGASSTAHAPATPPSRLAPLASLGKLDPASASASLGPEDVPVPNARRLAGSMSGSTRATVDGIQCQGAEQVLFHIHAHLTVSVDGTARRIPDGLGIPGGEVSATPVGPYVGAGSCFYWLHTHAADGIVHIESPVQRTYTLGNFFDVWRQKLTRSEVGLAHGPVVALYNGQVFLGNPRDIPLTKHAQIQLEVGRPLVAPVVIRFPAGL